MKKAITEYEQKILKEYEAWCKCKEMPIAYIKALEYAKKIQECGLSHLIMSN